jgi:dTDP-4-dehydrorhamnose reductase
MKKALKILVTGVSGQVGYSLLDSLHPFGEIIPSDLDSGDKNHPILQLDLSQTHLIDETLRKIQPDIIVNPAAYTAVDKAETNQDQANKINRDAPKFLAEYCSRVGIPLIHYSTDYVFPGSGSTPWNENDQPNPGNFYGASKLGGETNIINSGCTYFILRTSWVFSHIGHNFVKTMLRLGRDKKEIKVVDDQFGAPTSADFLAKNTALIIEKGLSEGFKKISGTYHLCNSGVTTWCEFAKEIFHLAKKKGMELSIENVLPILSADYPTPAQRPKNSRLNCDKFKMTFNTGSLQNWNEALDEVLEKLKEKNFMI